MFNNFKALAKVGYIDEKDRLNHTFTNGCEEELNIAINLYGQDILRYCHNILCDYHEAEDVVQVTFIKAYDKRKSFKAETSLAAWLYRIAYTTSMDYIRKKKIQQIFFNKEIRREAVINNESYISDELKDALLKISPRDRALIFSRVLDEKDYTELEVIYNASSQTLRKRYERAKKKLAQELRDNNFNY